MRLRPIAALGWDLLGNPARLRIQTIDSLNLASRGGCRCCRDSAPASAWEDGRNSIVRLPSASRAPSRRRQQVFRGGGNAARPPRQPRSTLRGLVIEMLARRDSWGAELPQAGVDPARARHCASARVDARRSSPHISRHSRGNSRASCLAEAWVAAGKRRQRCSERPESPIVELEHCATLPGETHETRRVARARDPAPDRERRHATQELRLQDRLPCRAGGEGTQGPWRELRSGSRNA